MTNLGTVGKAIDTMNLARRHGAACLNEMGAEWVADLLAEHERMCREAVAAYMATVTTQDPGTRARIEANLLAQAGLA